MEFPERRETTDFATNQINSFLEKKEYPIAVLFASIYVNIRLRSLVTDFKNPPKSEWKRTSKGITLDFNRLLKKCNKLKLIDGKESTALNNLRVKRNEVAHESRLWKGNLQDSEIDELRKLCESAMVFLKNTNEKRLPH